MAGIKNPEVAAILREWIERAGISQAEASRKLNVSSPVLWRQLEAKDSIPYTRIEQIVNYWAPSDEEITRLETFMNEVLTPVNHESSTESDHSQYAGKLDLIAQMLRNAIATNVPENMKNTVMTMADSIDDIAATISGQKKQRVESGEKFFTLPRKDPAIWRKKALLKKLDSIENSFQAIDYSSFTYNLESSKSTENKKHFKWVKSNQIKIGVISSKLNDLKEKASELDQIMDVSELDQKIKGLEPDIAWLKREVDNLLSSWHNALQ